MKRKFSDALEKTGWIVTGGNRNSLSMEPNEGAVDVYALVSAQGIEYGSITQHVGTTIVTKSIITPKFARHLFQIIMDAYNTGYNDH